MIQSAVDDALLGRVTATVGTAISVMAPAGGVVGGAIGVVVGSVTAMYGVSGVIAVVGFYYLLHPQVRSLPSVAEADEEALGLRSSGEIDTADTPPSDTAD